MNEPCHSTISHVWVLGMLSVGAGGRACYHFNTDGNTLRDASSTMQTVGKSVRTNNSVSSTNEMQDGKKDLEKNLD